MDTNMENYKNKHNLEILVVLDQAWHVKLVLTVVVILIRVRGSASEGHQLGLFCRDLNLDGVAEHCKTLDQDLLAGDQLLAGRLAHFLHLLEQAGYVLDLLVSALLRYRVHDHPEVFGKLLQLARDLHNCSQILLTLLALFHLK